jgi:hypothetical protein
LSSAYLGEKVVREKEYLSAIGTFFYLHKLHKCQETEEKKEK